MRRKTCSLIAAVFALAGTLSVMSCDEPDAQVTTITPNKGYEGDVVTIAGANFDPAGTTVAFNGAKAVLTSVTESQILTRVPSGATTGSVTVVSSSKTLIAPVFTVKTPPAISFTNVTRKLVTEADLNGNVIELGSEPITSHGFVYGTSPISSLSGGTVVSLGPATKKGAIFFRLSGLTKNTNYYVRVFSTTADATTLSIQADFRTIDTNLWIPMSSGFSKFITDDIYELSFSGENQYPTVNNKAYLISKYSSTNNNRVLGLYELDPFNSPEGFSAHSSAARMPDFPGVHRGWPARFAVGNKIYVGMGQLLNGVLVETGEIKTDFWAFAPDTKTWARVNDFVGTPFWSAVSIVVDGMAYVGFGHGPAGPVVTLWQYNPMLDKWTQRSAQPFSSGPALTRVMMAVAINGKGYYLFNRSGVLETWEYTPSTDSWTRKADFPGVIPNTFNPTVHPYVSFANSTHGYFADATRAIWEYNPSANSWAKLPEGFTGFDYGFILQNRIYLGNAELIYMLVRE